jgi:O-antigen ligase
VVGLIVLVSASGQGSAERFTGKTGGQSIMYRLGWWKMAFMMIEDHPIAGIGTGNFPKEYNRYSPRVPQVPRSPYWTHNSFLQTWAENGTFAFLAYVGLYAVAAGAMLKVIRTATDPVLRGHGVLMLSTVCAYFFFAGTSNILENENYWIVFALAAVVSALAREQRLGPGAPGETSGVSG